MLLRHYGLSLALIHRDLLSFEFLEFLEEFDHETGVP